MELTPGYRSRPVACLRGNDGVCFNGKISGYYTPGTFQQYTLGPANYVTPIPEKVDSAEAAPMLCGGVTTYAALRKSTAGPGDWVAVMGAYALPTSGSPILPRD